MVKERMMEEMGEIEENIGDGGRSGRGRERASTSRGLSNNWMRLQSRAQRVEEEEEEELAENERLARKPWMD